MFSLKLQKNIHKTASCFLQSRVNRSISTPAQNQQNQASGMTSFDGRILFLETPILVTQKLVLSKKKASTHTTSAFAENAPLEKIIMKNR
jgi:hypothetical protein